MYWGLPIFKLRPHPDSPCRTVFRVEAEAVRLPANGLQLSYAVIGRIGALRLPPAAAGGRGEELWRHSCFEAFVAASPGAGYCEFNFAPSTQWAVYGFDSYRSAMRVAESAAPRIAVQSSPERYVLQAVVNLPDSSRGPWRGTWRGPWRLGLAAVIEDTSGDKSYWALAHPPGKPDFHHPDCFACELPPP